MVWQYYYCVHYQTREGAIDGGRTVYYTPRVGGGGVLNHYSFGQRLLAETGVGLNPKALMICVWVLFPTMISRVIVPYGKPEWLAGYKDVIKQDWQQASSLGTCMGSSHPPKANWLAPQGLRTAWATATT